MIFMKGMSIRLKRKSQPKTEYPTIGKFCTKCGRRMVYKAVYTGKFDYMTGAPIKWLISCPTIINNKYFNWGHTWWYDSE
jgi:hypothetical protein